MLDELLLGTLDVGLRQVDLVDGHQNRHVRRARVTNSLNGLRHDAVVGGHHEHDDVGDLRAASPHTCERLVARRVDKHDAIALPLNFRRRRYAA